jgi:anaerobic sulfite reductase subunit C
MARNAGNGPHGDKETTGMKWTPDAEEKISRVPFFVRKRVRKKVEEEAARHGASQVRLEHLLAAQQRYLNNMEDEVRGYQVEHCFGENGCPNRAVVDEGMAGRVEALLSSRDLRSFLKTRVDGPLKLHHELRVSISDCPNGCSRPQIVDLGLIGATLPQVTPTPCTQCEACVETCREGAIELPPGGDFPGIDLERCVACGQCIQACPSGTLQESRRGYRILVGGKLGRHPQLGTDLGRVYTPDETLEMVERCIEHYLKHNRKGERFGEILNRTGLAGLIDPRDV